jgi:hypothetical protein
MPIISESIYKKKKKGLKSHILAKKYNMYYYMTLPRYYYYYYKVLDQYYKREKMEKVKTLMYRK